MVLLRNDNLPLPISIQSVPLAPFGDNPPNYTQKTVKLQVTVAATAHPFSRLIDC
jgi:hypothetical protein